MGMQFDASYCTIPDWLLPHIVINLVWIVIKLSFCCARTFANRIDEGVEQICIDQVLIVTSSRISKVSSS